MYTKKTIITHLLCKCILFYHGLIYIHDLRLQGLEHCLANNSLKFDHWDYLDWKVKKDEWSSYEYEFLSLLTVGDCTRLIHARSTCDQIRPPPYHWFDNISALLSLQLYKAFHYSWKRLNYFSQFCFANIAGEVLDVNIQALQSSCELRRQRKELHKSPWNCIGCKLIKVLASSWNFM